MTGALARSARQTHPSHPKIWGADRAARDLDGVFQPLRTAISLAVLAGALWAAFTVDLGGRTFAEHVDTIGQTPEAEQLIDGTRSRINPALQEVRDRLLGEYVEAPTWIPDADEAGKAPAGKPPKRAKATDEQTVPASTLTADGFEPSLPGRRKANTERRNAKPAASEDVSEPPLPGRRRPSSR
jgi:hypothetical protein